MKMLEHFKRLSITLTFLTIICSCSNTTSLPDAHFPVVITNNGPRGDIYTDSTGKSFAFRSFRVRVMNDTTVPLKLTINFSSDSVALLPKADRYLRVFLLPDTATPEKLYGLQAYNGAFIHPLNSVLNTVLNKSTELQTIIQPEQGHYINIGTIFSPQDGLTRAGLFVNGQDHHVQLVPIRSIKTGTRNKNELTLVFGIGIDQPHNYALIPCGKIIFESGKQEQGY
jgi:hypothetical protein